MTAFYHHHERHPADTTTCHRNLAIGSPYANCPFDALSQKHRTLVCGLGRGFVQRVADEIGCAGVTAVASAAGNRVVKTRTT